MFEPGVVESFVQHVAGAVREDTAFVMCAPWVGSSVPPRIFGCTPQSAGGVAPLNSAEMQELKNARIWLVPCNLQTPRDEDAVEDVMQQLLKIKVDACILLVVVLEEELKARLEDNSREAADIVVGRHGTALQMGADSAIVNPPAAPGKFAESVRLAHINTAYNLARCRVALGSEPGEGDVEYLGHLLQKHTRLLWDRIPRAILRNFPPCDPHVAETRHSVGHYDFVKVLETRRGGVLQAVDRRSQTDCVIKLTEKSAVLTLAHLEDFYREFTFLKFVLTHPNITKCLQMMHTPSTAYLVLNFCGDQNLKQLLHDQPNKCLGGADGEACFKQLVGAVAYCHSLRVSHRSISLEHVVVEGALGAGPLHCTLVDFRKALEAGPGANISRKGVCGALPCMAPEMALDNPYSPPQADCWSVGMVLLEMAGGLGAVQRAVGYHEEQAVASAATAIWAHFAATGGHEKVLSQAPATVDSYVAEVAEVLVRPVPAERADMQQVASDLKIKS